LQKPKKLLRDRSRIPSQRSWEAGPQNSAAIDADAGLGHTGGPADSGAAIFEYLVECPEDVTNAMLISTLWRTAGDKVVHMTYSMKAAIKPLRAHPYPLKKLVSPLDDEAFHEPNSIWIEPEHVQVVFFDDLFVSNYISGNLRYLRVSCISSVILLNKAAMKLVHAAWLLSLVDHSPGIETLIINAHVFASYHCRFHD
ncbi:hypothetical protein KCU78_g1492, partial [Aureobasidium melanogenum]